MSSTFTIQFQSPKKIRVRNVKKVDWVRNIREDYKNRQNSIQNGGSPKTVIQGKFIDKFPTVPTELHAQNLFIKMFL